MGEAHHKRGRGQNETHTTTPATQKERGEEPGGSRGQGERDTPAPEGYKRALTEFKKGAKDHTMMNTSVRVHTALQQHRKHDVEGKIPTQGQRPLVP